MAFITAALALAGCSPKPTQEAQVAASSEEAATPSAAPPPAPQAKVGAPRPGCAQNFAGFDANGDQGVTLQELLAQPHAHPDPEAVFRARDGDADGSLTADEFCSGWRGPTTAGQGPGSGAGTAGAGPGMGMGPGAGMGRGMGAGPGGGPRCEAHFARFDADGDANVTEAELAALPHPHGDAHAIFVARDQNRDGLLTKTEFCAPWKL